MVGFLAPPKSPKLIKIWLFFWLILKVEMNGNNLFYNHFICLHLNLWFTCSSFCRYCHLNFFPKWADSCIQAASIDDTVLLLYRRVISTWSWDGFVDGQGGWLAPPYTSTAINRPLLTDFQCHSIKTRIQLIWEHPRFLPQVFLWRYLSNHLPLPACCHCHRIPEKVGLKEEVYSDAWLEDSAHSHWFPCSWMQVW